MAEKKIHYDTPQKERRNIKIQQQLQLKIRKYEKAISKQKIRNKSRPKTTAQPQIIGRNSLFTYQENEYLTTKRHFSKEHPTIKFNNNYDEKFEHMKAMSKQNLKDVSTEDYCATTNSRTK